MVVFVLCSVTGQVFANTLEQQQRLGLSSPWYWPDLGCVGGVPTGSTSTSATGTNVKIAFNFFVANGFSATQAAGILGNLMEESGPSLSTTVTNSIGAYGIAQWTPASGRLTQMRLWVASKNGNPATLGGQTGQPVGQLDYIMYELNNNYTNVRDFIKRSSDLNAIVNEWNMYYEISGASDSPRLAYAQTALSQNGGQAAAGTGTAASNISDCSGSAAPPGQCANPFRDIRNLRPERIDQGVDYAGTGPVYAICSGTITNISGEGGWAYGGGDSFITVQFNYKGHNLTSYVAEGCAPAVKVGDQVTTSTKICTLLCESDSGAAASINSCSGIETGWAPTPIVGTKPIAQDYGGNGCCSTTAGVSYNRLLTSLGAPAGILTNNPPIGSALPSYYP